MQPRTIRQMQMRKQTTVAVHPPPAIRQRDFFTEAQLFQGGFGFIRQGLGFKILPSERQVRCLDTDQLDLVRLQIIFADGPFELHRITIDNNRDFSGFAFNEFKFLGLKDGRTKQH